jgi:hypothetical protein
MMIGEKPLGRAGTIAARLLVELGMEPRKAIASVRAVRPGAIETSEQERFVMCIGAKDRNMSAAGDDVATRTYNEEAFMGGLSVSSFNSAGVDPPDRASSNRKSSVS